jgi:uroporphyrinogen-III synthase
VIRPLVIIRPEPGLSATVALAEELGLPVVAEPLFAIAPRDWSAPPANEIDALLIGSANAVRHGGEMLGQFSDKPAYTVGAATAQAVREAGIDVAATGRGYLQPVVDSLAGQKLRILRLTGEEHVAVTPPPGVEIVTRVVYASVATPMPDSLAARLKGAVVLLHSAVAANHFASESDRKGVVRSSVAVAALAPRIAEAAGTGWEVVKTAAEPTDVALLALAQDMCHFALDG